MAKLSSETALAHTTRKCRELSPLPSYDLLVARGAISGGLKVTSGSRALHVEAPGAEGTGIYFELIPSFVKTCQTSPGKGTLRLLCG